MWYHIKRWLLTEWRFHRVAGLAVVVTSFICSCAADRAEVFARSGSIMCLAGGFLTFRRYLRGAENDFRRDTGIADQPAFGAVNPMTAKMDARKHDFTAMGWGIGYIIIGTGIWGYGDLLLRWFHICTK